VPGKLTWRDVRHPPASCGVRRLAAAVCRTGSPVRAPRTRHMRDAAAPPAVLVGAQHAVPGARTWLPVPHPPRTKRRAPAGRGSLFTLLVPTQGGNLEGLVIVKRRSIPGVLALPRWGARQRP
jgi:hypothetical protein